jgi:hypothetical protein
LIQPPISTPIPFSGILSALCKHFLQLRYIYKHHTQYSDINLSTHVVVRHQRVSDTKHIFNLNFDCLINLEFLQNVSISHNELNIDELVLLLNADSQWMEHQ